MCENDCTYGEAFGAYFEARRDMVLAGESVRHGPELTRSLAHQAGSVVS